LFALPVLLSLIHNNFQALFNLVYDVYINILTFYCGLNETLINLLTTYKYKLKIGLNTISMITIYPGSRDS